MSMNIYQAHKNYQLWKRDCEVIGYMVEVKMNCNQKEHENGNKSVRDKSSIEEIDGGFEKGSKSL